MGSDTNVWHQVHAQREDGVAAMFLIRDVEPRTDQPKIFVVELPYAVTDLSGQPDAAAYRRLSAFQEQWLEPACAALGWTFVAWKCEDGSFFLYLYGAGDPDAMLEKLAPFDGELGFFNDVDADWSEYAALRELVEQAEAEDGDGDPDDDDPDDHDHDHHDHASRDHASHDHASHDHAAHDHAAHDHAAHDHASHDHGQDRHDHAALELPMVDMTAEPSVAEDPAEAGPAPHTSNGKSRSIAAGSEAAAATHRPLPRTASPGTGVAKRARAATKAGPAQRTAAKPARRATTKPAPRATTKPAQPATAKPVQRATTKPAQRATTRPAATRSAKPSRPARPATTRPTKRTAASKPAKTASPAKRAAAPSTRRPAAKPRRSR